MARRVPVKTALVGLLFAPGAMAQQPPDQNAQAPDPTPPPTENKPADPNAAPATMQPVTVTGSRPSDDFQTTKTSINRLGAADLMDVPQSVVVINKALMDSQGATSLQSAIRNVPGVTIGAAEGGTIGNNFNITGFSARTDLYLVFALDAIEVLFGPASLLFGRGSTGGVINQVMKKPGLKKFTDLSASVTTNGLVRGTADVNVPFGEDSTSAARVNAMFQYGKASTLDMTTLQDFGFAPGVKLGIGTPTEITLQALLQHNHDQIPYGVPPLNGFPLNVPRNTEYGFADDATNQDVISLMATVDHAFNKDFKLRNQSMFNFVNTNVRETAGQAVGTVTAAGFVPAVNGPTGTPFSGVPLSQLFIRQQSHDRNIYDFTLDNQTELTAKFDTGPVGHTFLIGAEFAYESYWNQNYYRAGTCNGVAMQTPLATNGYTGCIPAGFTTGSNSPGNVPQQYGNLASAQAYTAAGYFNDTVQVLPWLKLVGGLRYDYYYAQIGNSQNSANIFGNTTIPYAAQAITNLSSRAGAIIEPTREQSYYFSYSTSFNPSLEQLVTTTGTSQPLPPEQNEAFEAGVKYEFLKGNLSVNAAAFQITKTNARSQNTDGTFSATGTDLHQRGSAQRDLSADVQPLWRRHEVRRPCRWQRPPPPARRSQAQDRRVGHALPHQP